MSTLSLAVPSTPLPPAAVVGLLVDGAREMRATRFAGVVYGLFSC